MLDKIPIKVGKNLKMLRKSRDLSLDRLSEMTGVSKAMLAQVERGDSNPTITLLWKIANGLRISVTELIAEETAEVTVVRAADMEPIESEGGLYKSYPVFPFDAKAHFEVYFVEMKPGCEHSSDPHHDGVEEYVMVIKGNIRLQIGEETYRAGTGDAIRFPADQGHTYYNDDNGIARLQVIILYPF